MHVLIGGKSMVYYNLKHEFMAINTINHRFLTNQKLKCVTHLFQSMSSQPKINAGFNIVCQHLRYFFIVLLL